MRAPQVDLRRRRFSLWAPLAGFGGWLLAWPRRAGAAEKASLLARPVERIPTDPNDSAWTNADSLEIPLAPQAVVKPRTYETGVKALKIRALYTADRLGFLVEWRDKERNSMEGGVQAFRDAVALEFPAEPAKGIPFFGMGERERPVTIYQWKSDWDGGSQHDVDEKYPHMVADWYPFSGRAPGEIAEAADYGKSDSGKAFVPSWWAGNPLGNPALQSQRRVEKLVARGFGTIEPVAADKQDGEGKGEWKDGVWKVVFTVPRAQDHFTFERGQTVPIAFAAWNGANQERGGEKAVSTWYFLSLEQPIGAVAYVSPALVVAGAVLAEVAGLRWWRRWADRKKNG